MNSVIKKPVKLNAGLESQKKYIWISVGIDCNPQELTLKSRQVGVQRQILFGMWSEILHLVLSEGEAREAVLIFYQRPLNSCGGR